MRHDLHEQLYVAAIEAGKSLLAEKPFGIDLASARTILAAVGAIRVLRPLLQRAALPLGRRPRSHAPPRGRSGALSGGTAALVTPATST